jgi:hypothetical protein
VAEGFDEYASWRRKATGELEAAMYAEPPLLEAVAEGLEAGRISAAEAVSLQRMLGYSSWIVREFVREERDALEALCRDLGDPEVVKALGGLARLLGVKNHTVPVYPVARPGEKAWARMEGGRLVVAAPRGADAVRAALHRLASELLARKQVEIEAAAATVEDLTPGALTEALAQAFADKVRPRGTTSPRLTLLTAGFEPALAGEGSFEEFLSRMVEAWARLRDGSK